MPQTWQQIASQSSTTSRSTSDAVRVRDQNCRMTEYAEDCEVAHLCPKRETVWFQSNAMGRYCVERKTGNNVINDKSNCLLSREDLHTSFDKLRFAFVPKESPTGISLVTHMLVHARQHCEQYHNAKLHPIGVSREVLLVRFAWTIFPLLTNWLQQGHQRLLLLAEHDQSEEVDSRSCYNFALEWSASTSRTPSPTKRAWNADHGPGADEATDDVGKECLSGRLHDPPEANGSLGQDQIHESQAKRIKTKCHNSTEPFISPTSSPELDALRVTATCYNDVPLERTRIDEMVKLALAKERQASDPGGNFGIEQAWLQKVMDNEITIDSSNSARFAYAIGYDVVDES